jgi:DNA-binding NtrC family response regulator
MKKLIKIFSIEDDPFYGKMIAHTLEKSSSYEVKSFSTGKDFLDHLHERPDVVTIDHNLPDYNGLEILEKIQAFDRNIATIIVSGQEDVGVAVNAYKKGANYYIIKSPDALTELELCVGRLANQIDLQREVEDLREQIIDRHKYDTIIGESTAVLRVVRLLQKIENNSVQVLITGESGTGKEVIARAIHYNSPRKRKPFVAVNVSAIPEDLIESELFGHEKGAFTGASSKRIGKFEEASGGTILLDEIGEMDINMQTKLLRVLQEKVISRIGSNKEIAIDARIMAATNKNLAQRVKEGLFREDLYYRLQGFILELPPLRARDNDVIILARHFLDSFTKQNKLSRKSFSRESIEAMLSHPWPGNVRELKSFVERAALICDADVITQEDLLFSPSIA